MIPKTFETLSKLRTFSVPPIFEHLECRFLEEQNKTPSFNLSYRKNCNQFEIRKTASQLNTNLLLAVFAASCGSRRSTCARTAARTATASRCSGRWSTGPTGTRPRILSRTRPIPTRPSPRTVSWPRRCSICRASITRTTSTPTAPCSASSTTSSSRRQCRPSGCAPRTPSTKPCRRLRRPAVPSTSRTSATPRTAFSRSRFVLPFEFLAIKADILRGKTVTSHGFAGF